MGARGFGRRVLVWKRGCAGRMTRWQDAEGGVCRLGGNWLKFWQTGDLGVGGLTGESNGANQAKKK